LIGLQEINRLQCAVQGRVPSPVIYTPGIDSWSSRRHSDPRQRNTQGRGRRDFVPCTPPTPDNLDCWCWSNATGECESSACVPPHEGRAALGVQLGGSNPLVFVGALFEQGDAAEGLALTTVRTSQVLDLPSAPIAIPVDHRSAPTTPSTCITALQSSLDDLSLASASDTSSTRAELSLEGLWGVSGSPGGAKTSSTSDSPLGADGFLALRPTISSTSTVRSGGVSFEETRGGSSGGDSLWYGGSDVASSSGINTGVGRSGEGSTRVEGDEGRHVAMLSPAASPLARTVSNPVETPSLGGSVTPTPNVRSLRRHSSRPRASTGVGSSPYPTARYVHVAPSPIRSHSYQTPSPIPVTASSLQSHLYTSGLLQSALSDLHLVVFNHIYRLHRIVLGQSGYFTSLLSGGFSEERRGPASTTESEVIEVEMDRPMTRCAWEACLATLYGGGPELVPPPWARTSVASPLSSMYERLGLRVTEGVVRSERTTASQWSDLEAAGVQPATPTFLLSLLAQSTYLEIPVLQTKALEMIHATITPFTVGQYLGYVSPSILSSTVTDNTPCSFALGQGLGPASSTANFHAGLRGLEGVGTPYDFPRSRTTTNGSFVSSTYSTASSISGDETSPCEDSESSSFVGPEGERVGEACACWLAKWGSEVLAVEEWLEEGGNPAEYDQLPDILRLHPDLTPPPLRVWSSLPGGMSARWVRGIISSDAFFVRSSVGRHHPSVLSERATGIGGELDRYLFARRVVELRRRERATRSEDRVRSKGASGGDCVTPQSESESFEVAMGTVMSELDRRESEGGEGAGEEDTSAKETEQCNTPTLPDSSDDGVDLDELEYTELFEGGIHYSHLVCLTPLIPFSLIDQLSPQSFEELSFIAHDLSPTTGLPYVPKAVIERAFWQSAEFKSRIPVSPSPFAHTSHATYSTGAMHTLSAGPRDAVIEDKAELGLSALINPDLDGAKTGSSRRYFLVPIDDTTRLNDGPLPGSSTRIDSPSQAKVPTLPTGPNAFFGLALETRTGSDSSPGEVLGSVEESVVGRRFVPYEPCRFSAEFWGVGDLREKQRLYSSTFFYAGVSPDCVLPCPETLTDVPPSSVLLQHLSPEDPEEGSPAWCMSPSPFLSVRALTGAADTDISAPAKSAGNTSHSLQSSTLCPPLFTRHIHPTRHAPALNCPIQSSPTTIYRPQEGNPGVLLHLVSKSTW
jgi:hypothetical protein